MKRTILLLLVVIISAILMQGFQCATKEITTAKVAMQSNDYPKAKQQLEQALIKNPKNDEAWYLLGQVKETMMDFKGAAEAYSEAEKNAITPEVVKFLPNYIIRFWTGVLNLSISYYNNYVVSKDKNSLDTALFLLDIVPIVRPDMSRVYALKGIILETKNDTNSAILAYSKYASLQEKNIRFAEKNNFYLDIPREEIIKKFGRPISTHSSRASGEYDSTTTDVFSIDNNEFYLYSSKKIQDFFRVKGWYYNPPVNLTQQEKIQWQNLDINPFAALASIFYERKDFDNSMKYVKVLHQLQPEDEKASAFLVELYNVQGKLDEAKKMLSDLIKQNPNNKLFYAQFGDIHLLSKDFDEAIVHYQNAIKLDPDYDIVLRNLASAHKNRASAVQSKQREKAEKDKKFQPNIEEYIPDLRKSAEYFEKCLNYSRFKNDLDIIGELINIYEVLDNHERINKYLAVLEKISVKPEDKENYYRILCKVYTLLKIADKRKSACDKYQELMK